MNATHNSMKCEKGAAAAAVAAEATLNECLFLVNW